ncbi:hypothetical protein [uncultured Methanobrevibacter sp.]|uniref:hypothetical protein n=1 Tax=uncultured Methanobrevibacter sp. TaxID=253161 RepID=UPI0025D3CAE9|nr:hypothetical protein [uncultured Methanobrevibacter sp.]
MSDKLQDCCLEYIRLCAVWNHLMKYNGTLDEVNMVLGELEALKHKMREELK